MEILTDSVGERVRKMEQEYIRGSTSISKYVTFSMLETLDKIDAYLNAKHITGSKDSHDRQKPFFDIVTAAVNVWYRATDIDRKHIRVIATKQSDWLNSFAATVVLQDWMRRSRFATFLNEWGRTLARYGSAVVKFVEKDGELHMQIVPWNRIICDPVDFDAGLHIEVIELTEPQLRQRIETHGYDKEQVEALSDALVVRESIDRRKKDNKSEYVKLYEVHGLLPLKLLTDKDSDQDVYVQQMHVIAFVGKKKGRTTEYDDFTLVSGREEKDPYEITHLIKEPDRTLAIGAVEHLFQAQWMINHSMKAIKDSLDLASKNIFQTADTSFVGRNVLNDLVTGDVLIHSPNMPVSQVNNQAHDIVSWQNYAVAWQNVGKEINGISEAMMGAQPKAGQAWRQTEAILNESYSLFELMTENKGNHIEDWLRVRIIPFLKKRKLNNADEVSALLESYDLRKLDARYIKSESIKRTNEVIADKVINRESVTQDTQAQLMEQTRTDLQEQLNEMGNQRFIVPSELSDKTWKEQFKELEWDLEIDITGESRDVAQMMTTLNTALTVAANPAFEQSPKAQAIVGRILELTGAMSPVEYYALPSAPSTVSTGQPLGVDNLPKAEPNMKNNERTI